jgi:hypothetical protein
MEAWNYTSSLLYVIPGMLRYDVKWSEFRRRTEHEGPEGGLYL